MVDVVDEYDVEVVDDVVVVVVVEEDHNDIEVDGEGFVINNEYGCFKLVDRPCFAYANFNSGKFANK